MGGQGRRGSRSWDLCRAAALSHHLKGGKSVIPLICSGFLQVSAWVRFLLQGGFFGGMWDPALCGASVCEVRGPVMGPWGRPDAGDMALCAELEGI